MSSEQDYSQARWNPDWLLLELVEEASSIMTKVLRDLFASCENIKSSAWWFWLQCLFCTWLINLIIPPASAESVKGCVCFIVGDRKGLPGGSVIKNPPVMQEMKGTEFDPWVGKIPWRRAWQTTPVFLPGESHGPRSLAGYSPWGCKELNVTEHAHYNSTILRYFYVSGTLYTLSHVILMIAHWWLRW